MIEWVEVFKIFYGWLLTLSSIFIFTIGFVRILRYFYDDLLRDIINYIIYKVKK